MRPLEVAEGLRVCRKMNPASGLQVRWFPARPRPLSEEAAWGTVWASQAGYVCGAGPEGGLDTVMCVIPWLRGNSPPFFSFLNLKVTLLEAPNVELTLNWKEDLFRARALFLWIFCLTNHGECELGEKSVKEAAHSFQGAEELFWRRKVSSFSWPFDPLRLRGRRTWRNYSNHQSPPTCC